MMDVTRPDNVTLDGRHFSTANGSGVGWTYQTATETLTVRLGPHVVASKANIVAIGTRPTNHSEPAATSATS